jgi:hypothetical protein
MVGMEAKDCKTTPVLDGRPVSRINSDLTSGLDFTAIRPLTPNRGRCFMGTTKVGAFDIAFEDARELLRAANPNGRPSSDVVRPFRNGSDLVRVCSHRWIIDFGVGTRVEQAALYEAAFQYVVKNVKPSREHNNDKWRSEHWWLLGRTVPEFRDAISGSPRYLATPRVSKYRVFVWQDSVILPDSKVIAIAMREDSALGILQSRAHEAWTLATCGWHGVGNDATYNPTLCFETFPFPAATPEQNRAICTAAKELDDLRNRWLNPPEWTKTEVLEFPGSVDGPWRRYVVEADARGIGMVRWPRTVPKDGDCAASLGKRTLTNLYNQRPAWLDLAHKKLDEAVLAAYGWENGISDDELLAKLLALNLERAGATA